MKQTPMRRVSYLTPTQHFKDSTPRHEVRQRESSWNGCGNALH